MTSYETDESFYIGDKRVITRDQIERKRYRVTDRH